MLEHIFKPSARLRSSEIFKVYTPELLGEDVIIETNRMGLREKEIIPKKDNEIVVLYLGDSFIAGTQVNKDFNMSSISEKILNDYATENMLNVSFRSINAGVDGYNLINSFENYKRIAEVITPDIVVLGVYLGNDILSYSKYLTTDMKIKHFLLKHFYILRLLKVLKSQMEHMMKGDNENIQSTDRNLYEKALNREKLSRLYSKYFSHTSLLNNTDLSHDYPKRSIDWLTDLMTEENIAADYSVVPKSESKYQSTAYVISEIHNAVTKSSIPLLIYLFSVPPAYDDNELHFALEYYELAEKHIDKNLPQRLIKQALKKYIGEQGWNLIDLTPPLSVASKDRSCNIPMDTHFNAQGHKIAGESVAKEIMKLSQFRSIIARNR